MGSSCWSEFGGIRRHQKQSTERTGILEEREKTQMKLQSPPYPLQQTQHYSGSQQSLTLRSHESGISLRQQQEQLRRPKSVYREDFLPYKTLNLQPTRISQEFVTPRNSFIIAPTGGQQPSHHLFQDHLRRSSMPAVWTTPLSRTSQEFEFIPPRNLVTTRTSTGLHVIQNNSVMMTPTGPQPLHRLSQDSTSSARRNSTPGGIKFKIMDPDGTDIKNENIFPDGIKIEKSQYQHFAVKFLWKGNFMAPVKEMLKTQGTMVLDIGCGDASWIFDTAKDYPNSRFIGIDIQSDLAWKKKQTNVKFREFDFANNGLPYKNDYFDYVHGRFLGTQFTESEYCKKVIEESIRVTKPGGIIELFESEFRWVNEGPALKKLLDGYREMLELKDINPHLSLNIGRYLRDTGYVIHIRTETRLLPLGGWAGRLGEIASEVIKDGLEDGKIALSQSMHMSSTEYDSLCMEATFEFDEYNVQMPTVRWYCTKRQPRRNSLFVPI
ncbi:2905_t:CDS:2 [Ambispora leptoticha]|uniref:2905_t:CDS:1 n=1 Tax=Ambispora leptoticha TaxID=144679 RepID=A0A9N8V9P1_9GLOM|nr:2905_t:CDS:2 [Ambispora leptoticha]